jgi:hypothetical protein
MWPRAEQLPNPNHAGRLTDACNLVMTAECSKLQSLLGGLELPDTV